MQRGRLIAAGLFVLVCGSYVGAAKVGINLDVAHGVITPVGRPRGSRSPLPHPRDAVLARGCRRRVHRERDERCLGSRRGGDRDRKHARAGRRRRDRAAWLPSPQLDRVRTVVALTAGAAGFSTAIAATNGVTVLTLAGSDRIPSSTPGSSGGSAMPWASSWWRLSCSSSTAGAACASALGRWPRASLSSQPSRRSARSSSSEEPGATPTFSFRCSSGSPALSRCRRGGGELHRRRNRNVGSHSGRDPHRGGHAHRARPGCAGAVRAGRGQPPRRGSDAGRARGRQRRARGRLPARRGPGPRAHRPLAWDIRRDVVTWSDELYRIFGLAEGPRTSTTPPTSSVSTQRIASSPIAPSNEPSSSGVRSAFEHRVIRPDGTERVVAGRGRVIVEGDEPVAMLGTAQDVTEQRQAERLRDDILSAVSHELRTPLTSVSGFAAHARAAARRLSREESARLIGSSRLRPAASSACSPTSSTSSACAAASST